MTHLGNRSRAEQPQPCRMHLTGPFKTVYIEIVFHLEAATMSLAVIQYICGQSFSQDEVKETGSRCDDSKGPDHVLLLSPPFKETCAQISSQASSLLNNVLGISSRFTFPNYPTLRCLSYPLIIQLWPGVLRERS